MTDMTDGIAIAALRCAILDAAQLAEIDAIFFGASNTQSFASADARAAFRERWLGRYLTHDAETFYVARAADGAIAGYLAGCLDDPARTPRFSDIGYFATFAPLTLAYPAHLHVNLAPGFRGQGIGGRLIEQFAADAKAAGAPGMHVVTSSGARNVAFYQRKGFAEAGRQGEGSGAAVFLARKL